MLVAVALSAGLAVVLISVDEIARWWLGRWFRRRREHIAKESPPP